MGSGVYRVSSAGFGFILLGYDFWVLGVGVYFGVLGFGLWVLGYG